MEPLPLSTLDAIRDGAYQRAATVRALASFAEHTDCRLAGLAFVARVDLDRLLEGTPFAGPRGQSPFAFSRGIMFERSLIEHGSAALLALLRERLAFPIGDSRIINLREGYPEGHAGHLVRAHDTRLQLQLISQGDPSAANLIHGAVMMMPIGGVPAYFEADAVAARTGGRLHVGEIKSFPIIDGRADPVKAGEAFDQVAVYIVLLRREIVLLHGDPSVVTAQSLLIAPSNTGLTPTLRIQDTTRRIHRVEQLLDRVPAAGDVVALVPSGLRFGQVADPARDVEQRLAGAHAFAEHVGTRFKPSCMATCGLGRFCRARARAFGSPQLVGPEVVRALAGVESFDRARELAAGAPPSPTEEPVAAQLVRAERLYTQYADLAAPGAGRHDAA